MDRTEELIAAWQVELPEAVTPATEFAKRVLDIGERLRGAIRAALVPLELTTAEYDVLAALRRVGSPYRLKPGVLAAELLLSTGGVTKTVHALRARDLVERDPEPADGRSNWVRLTDSGVDLAERALLASTRAQHELLAGTDLRAATTALRRLTRNLDAGQPSVGRRRR